MKKRIGWIDIAKGVCMLSIILGHTSVQELKFVYMFHLPVFFLLAGYTMKAAPVDADFLKKKFSRLMHPYFMTCFCVMCMAVVNAVVIDRRLTIPDFTGIVGSYIRSSFYASGALMNLGDAQYPVIGAIWFLPAMFFALVFSALLLQKCRSAKVVFGIALPTALLSALSARYVWLPFSLQAGLFATPFVLIGHYAREKEVFSQKRISWFILSGVIFIGGCFTSYGKVFWMVSATAKDYLITPLIALAASYFVIRLSILADRFRVTRILTTPFRLMGKYSLEILCVHLFEMNTTYAYVTKALSLLRLPDRLLFRLPLRFVLIAMLVAIVVLIKKGVAHLRSRPKRETASETRNAPMDVLRAMMITVMIAGHFPIDPTLRAIIFSVHMPVFLFVSGYFQKDVTAKTLPQSLLRHLKSLRYYLLYAALYLLHKPSLLSLKTLLLGVSFTKNLLPDAVSVGPVYFILLLFLVKLIYLPVAALIKKESVQNLVLGGLVCVGFALGRLGWWLPWSADCALFCLAFYRLGYYVKKYRVLPWLCDRPWLYFALTPVWFYMIRQGSLELAARNYGNSFGFAVVGSVCGILTAWLLAAHLANRLPAVPRVLVCAVGEATAYILILHTLYGPRFNVFCADVLGLAEGNLFFYVATVALQVLVGTGAGILIRMLKQLLFRPRRNRNTPDPSAAAPAAG